jgi:ribonuclease P protein component
VSERGAAGFPKRARLRKRGDYLRVQHDGRRHHTEHFVVLTVPTAHANSRIGITVSSRVGGAVVRNRVKRVLREVLRAWWRDLDPPGDLVVIAKPGAGQITHANAASELRRALQIPNA